MRNAFHPLSFLYKNIWTIIFLIVFKCNSCWCLMDDSMSDFHQGPLGNSVKQLVVHAVKILVLIDGWITKEWVHSSITWVKYWNEMLFENSGPILPSFLSRKIELSIQRLQDILTEHLCHLAEWKPVPWWRSQMMHVSSQPAPCLFPRVLLSLLSDLQRRRLSLCFASVRCSPRSSGRSAALKSRCSGSANRCPGN